MNKGYTAYSRRTNHSRRFSNKGSAQFRQPKHRTKRSRLPNRAVKGLTKKVKELTRLAESDMGTHIHRIRAVSSIIAIANATNHGNIVGNSLTKVEQVLALLRYYDPSNPGTLIQASGVEGTFQKDFFFSRTHAKLTVRNNYQVPCNVRVYACTPRDDTSLDALTAFTSGLADVGNPSNISPLVFLTDSKLFTDLWNIEKSKMTILQPGSQCVLSWSGKPYQYDPSTGDVHNLAYQRLYQAMNYIVFISGVPCHDSVALENGTIGCGVDTIMDAMWEVKYPAGADINFVTINNGSVPFSNKALVSNKPVADNQGYQSS